MTSDGVSDITISVYPGGERCFYRIAFTNGAEPTYYGTADTVNEAIGKISRKMGKWTNDEAVTVARGSGEINQVDWMKLPLPCDVRVGKIVFSKGVKIGYLIDSAARWQEACILGRE